MTPAAPPLVSVLVPTVGRLEYLPQTLDSLRSQTLREYEAILLDNASPPEACPALAALAAENPRLRVMRSEERLPMFSNFNRGFAAARGRYVAYFHDDDIYLPDFLRAHVALLEANPRVGFAGANYYEIDAVGQTLRCRRLIAETSILPGLEFIRRLMRTGRGLIPTPGIVFRRAAFGEAPFDERLPIYFGDFLVTMRAAEQHDVGLIAEPLMRLRQHGANASAIPLRQSIEQRTALMRAYCDELVERRPEQGAFVAELVRGAEGAARNGLLWAWASASDPSESGACLQALSHAQGGRALTRVVTAIDWVCPAGRRRRALFGVLARAAGLRMG